VPVDQIFVFACLYHLDVGSALHQLGSFHDVPFGESNAVVPHVWGGGIEVIDANALFVQRDPNDIRRIVWTRRQFVKVRAALSLFERTLVVTEIFHFCDGRDIAFSVGRDGLR